MSSILAKHTYNHLAAGHPDNPKPFDICGAKTRGEFAKYPVCTMRAGWGTSHKGAGRCKDHGGCSLSGPASPQWTGGRRSYLYRERLAAQFKEVMDATQASPLDLTAELEAKRVILALALDDLLKSKKSPSVNKGGMGGVEDNGMVIEKAADSPPSLLSIDPEKIALVRDLSNDVVKTATSIIAAKNQTALARAEILLIQGVFKKAIEQFVPVEQRRSMVKYIQSELRGLYTEEEGEAE